MPKLQDFSSDASLKLAEFQSRFVYPFLLRETTESGKGTDWSFTTQGLSIDMRDKVLEQAPADPNPNQMVYPLCKSSENPFGEKLFVGRTRRADIYIEEGSVSKTHGYFSRQEESWILVDTNSTNGTFVDGRRLSPYSPTLVMQDMLLGFGDVLVTMVDAATIWELLNRC